VQRHVHDEVLRRALEVRGEEIADDIPPVSIQELQRAHETIRSSPRPEDWKFPREWSEYEVLHVDADASKRLTHTAYKTIVFNVHPDRNKGRVNWANEATKQVNAAWNAVQKNWEQANPGQRESGN
jgi:signal recognition particle subunit SEC65